MSDIKCVEELLGKKVRHTMDDIFIGKQIFEGTIVTAFVGGPVPKGQTLIEISHAGSRGTYDNHACFLSDVQIIGDIDENETV